MIIISLVNIHHLTELHVFSFCWEILGSTPNMQYSIFFLSRCHTQRGAWAHDPEIKSHMLYRLSQPGAPAIQYYQPRSPCCMLHPRNVPFFFYNWKFVPFDSLHLFPPPLPPPLVTTNLFFVSELGLNVCLLRDWERERERERGRGAERGRERIHTVSTEPDAGLNLMNCEVMT